jgi:hypothetical protein
MKTLNGTKMDLSSSVTNEAERGRIWEIITKLGYKSPIIIKEKPYVFIHDNTYTNWTDFQDYFECHEYREITLKDLERLLAEVSPKGKKSLNFTKIGIFLMMSNARNY